IGRVHHRMGEVSAALDHYQKALSIEDKVQDSVGKPDTLYNLARVERDRGNLAEAQAHSEAALKVVESLRTKVASRELRSSYVASIRQQYELNIDLLMRMHRQRPQEGFDAAALQASERARARSLLEGLVEAGTDIRQGVDSDLLEREHAL